MDRYRISKWEVELRAPDRVNTPGFTHDTRLYQINIKMTINYKKQVQIAYI